MRPLPLFLAWRYLKSTHQSYPIHTMIIICIIGMTIGSAALTLTLIITQGFEKATHEKLRSITPAYTMEERTGEDLHFPAIASVLHNEFSSCIHAFAPSSMSYVMVQNDNNDTLSTVIILRAIDSKYEKMMQTFNNKLYDLEGNLLTLDKLSPKGIIVGKTLAQRLAITALSPSLTLFSPQPVTSNNRTITFSSYPALVQGILDTGIEEFDNGLMLCSFTLFSTLNPTIGVQQIHLELVPSVDEKKIITSLKNRFSLEVSPWYDRYPALMSALKLEKYAMGFVLALIAIVAAMNVMSLLFMYITHKKADVAILRTLGMTSFDIRLMFISIGFIISLIAASIGVIGATIIGLVLQWYPFIRLPDAYYVTYVPAYVNGSSSLFVFMFVLLMGLFASWLPTRFVLRNSIVHMLRF